MKAKPLFALAVAAGATLVLAGCSTAPQPPADDAKAQAVAAAQPVAAPAEANAAAEPAVDTGACSAPAQEALTCQLPSGGMLTLCAAPKGEAGYLAWQAAGADSAQSFPADATQYRKAFFKESGTAGKLYANVRGPKGVFATVMSSQKPDTYAVSLVRSRLPKGWNLPKADAQAGCVGVTGADWLPGFVKQLPFNRANASKKRP